MTMHPEIAELLGDTAANLPASVQSPTGDVAAASVGGVAYDAANVVDKLGMWRPAIRSADADIIPEKETLDARSRDMIRNDAYVSNGQEIHKNSIVGSLFLLNAKPNSKILFGKQDDVWETEFQEEVEDKFMLTAESPQHWFAADRRRTLTETVRLAVAVDVAGGEVLMTSEWMPNDGRPYRTAVQMVDTDRLSDPVTIDFNKKIRGGVEVDSYGAPIAYHLREQHPNDLRLRAVDWEGVYKWKRVPARKPWGRQMVLHIFEQNRVGQSRGVAAMVTALTEMRMTKHFRKTELERAVIAATYAASIESDLPTGDVYAAMGAGSESNPAMNWLTDYLAAISEYSGGAKNLHISGTKIPVFLPGTHLKIQNPGANGPVGDKFEASLLRHISAALRVPYAELSKNYSEHNYSSHRAEMAAVRLGMNARKKRVADAAANFIYRNWLEEAINYNDLECLKRRNVPAFYDRLNAEAYSSCDWIGAGVDLIDPLKETQADVLALKNHLTTLEDVIARRSGGDWRKKLRQMARERTLEKEMLEVSVFDGDSTDMQNSLSGEPQERQS
jgi:lambda family phage portal protein